MHSFWKIIYFAVPPWILFASHGSPCRADQASLNRVRSEYREALTRLESLYPQAQATIRFEERKPDKLNQKSTRSTISLLSVGHYSREIITEVDDAQRSEIVYVTNPNHSFRLTREAQGQPYVIQAMEDDGERSADQYGRQHFSTVIGAAYSAFGRPMSRIMSLPTFRMIDASVESDGSRDLLKIDFEFRPGEGFPIVPAWILVDPAQGWAMQRYEGLFGSKRDRPRTGAVEYGPPVGGRPVAKRFTYNSASGNDIYEVERISFDVRLDERDFTLSEFGLPEVGEPPVAERSVPMNMMLVGLGLLAVVAAIVLRYLARRSSARAA